MSFKQKLSIFLLIDKKTLGPTHTIGYNLRGLMPASVYEVSVTARNRYGTSDSSVIKRFATGGESNLFQSH